MSVGFDPGALLARYYELPRGPRVRLRLARTRDCPAIADLFARQGFAVEPFELGSLLRSHPRERLVLCACTLVGSAESVLGIGAIELPWGGEPCLPSLLVVDRERTAGLDALLDDALCGRAGLLSGARAA